MTKKTAGVVVKTEEHHRRPRSLGGSNDPSNISYVLRTTHEKWHVLFGNMNALQICNIINSSPWKPEGLTVTCRFINGNEVILGGEHRSKNKNKCKEAWSVLFKDLSFYQVIPYINNVWLDPAYHFYIRK